MSDSHTDPTGRLLAELPALLPTLEAMHRDVHAHPELSMHESRTAGIVATYLKVQGYEVTTGVGKTGVVGPLRNGDGPTVMLRADMDALPIREETGLDYASRNRMGRSLRVLVRRRHRRGDLRQGRSRRAAQ